MIPREPIVMNTVIVNLTKKQLCWFVKNNFLLMRHVLRFKLNFLNWVHSMQGWTVTTTHGVTRKRSRKRLKHLGNLFIKDLKPFRLWNQKKTFYRQRIPESSCVMKETVDIDILVTSRNGDRKIKQCIRITSRPPREKRSGTFWVSPEEHLSK